jgi:hypothetical protein
MRLAFADSFLVAEKMLSIPYAFERIPIDRDRSAGLGKMVMED